jgi:hypothetical protein
MSRRLYEVLIERVFRSEEKKQDSRVGRADIEALEKEISIDIADLRRDIRALRRDLLPHGRAKEQEKAAVRKASATLRPPSVIGVDTSQAVRVVPSFNGIRFRMLEIELETIVDVKSQIEIIQLLYCIS